MPLIKYRSSLDHIMKKPVFGTTDLHNEGIPQNYSKKLLHGLCRTRRIKRIERGKYTCLDDPIAVAAHITTPCYLSLWTAMSIRGLTDQNPFSVEVFTSRKRFRSRIDFGGTKIIFHLVKPRMMFGFENIVWKESIRIPVARTEKIIIDGIGRLPEEEILQMLKVCDSGLLKKYAKLSGSIKMARRIRELTGKC